MQMYYETEETEKLEFARKAAAHFAENPQDVTFTVKGVEKGVYMALRWGMGDDCVLVVKLDEYFEPVNYAQFIDREKAKLASVYHDAGEAALEKAKGEKS